MGYIQHKSEESIEDYLETILILSKRLTVVRSIDIAVHLGVNPEIAAADACKMEHDISPESYEAMKKYILSILKR